MMRFANPSYAASTSEMARFETELLATEENLEALPDLSGLWIDRAYERTRFKTLVLDMDSSDSPTFGQQEGSTFNGHFGFTCYHPLFVFNQFGDLERAMLRPDHVHSSKGWREALEPVVALYRGRKLPRFFRRDAGFASPEVYEFLEAEDYSYRGCAVRSTVFAKITTPSPVFCGLSVNVIWAFLVNSTVSPRNTKRVLSKTKGISPTIERASKSNCLISGKAAHRAKRPPIRPCPSHW